MYIQIGDDKHADFGDLYVNVDHIISIRRIKTTTDDIYEIVLSNGMKAYVNKCIVDSLVYNMNFSNK
jgi:hypothetical protein